MTPDRKKEWKCQECVSKQPKTNNSNTPVRSTVSAPDKDDGVAIKIMGKTKYKRPDTHNNEESSDDEQTADDSILGDTQNSPSAPNTAEKTLGIITLEQISQLLDKKLETNEIKIKSFLKAELRILIKEEIEKTMKKEITNCLNKVSAEQNKLKSEIDSLTQKINVMETQYNKLQESLTKIQTQQPTTTSANNCSNENSKKFVLYGLDENEWETEYDVYDRVINLFHDVVNVDLNGYIEDITRLGKRGYRRPVIIELLSKKMTKYILQHSRLFSRSGLSVAELLDNEGIKKRNELGKILQKARKEGKHAIIRNNRLFIEGIEYRKSQSEENNENPLHSKVFAEETTSTPINKHNQNNKNIRSFRN